MLITFTSMDFIILPINKNEIGGLSGKPLFIKHRSKKEIEEANSVSLNELPHPELDKDGIISLCDKLNSLK